MGASHSPQGVEMDDLVLRALMTVLAAYFWLRFGPKRSPSCRRLVFGHPGVPVGIRRFHFRCGLCSTRFEGHRRLPL